jgi:alkyldihydroxyacetonephosphate synthase
VTERAGRTRSFWHWGYEDALPGEDERRSLGAQVAFLLGVDPLEPGPLPSRAAVRVRAPRVADPRLAFATQDEDARILSAHGRAFPDLLRGFEGDFRHAPDLVLRPTREEEIDEAFALAERLGLALVPHGGGTSVVGGVEYRGERPWAALRMDAFDRVLEVDDISLAARIQAGAPGPVLEAQLAAYGLSMRFYPQSFELSTLGGWIVTRAGGHFATGPTHVDDLVESVRMRTPRGLFETRRLPASGAGPDPNRLVLGSEGALGVVTEAWVRVLRRPRFRASATVRFRAFERAAAAARVIVQAGLAPANCRVLDEKEALIGRVADGQTAILLLGFESADHEPRASMDRALALAAAEGGTTDGAIFREEGEKGRSGEADRWRASFLRGPYLQSALLTLGLVVDTFESACSWRAFPELHREVVGSVTAAIEALGGRGIVSCRFTHVYPDGPAPYYTFVVLAPGERLETWTRLKRAASDAILRAGGTITHHHAVGRTHRPWYDRERSPPFASVLEAAKRALDPAGILNPGVLVG